MLGATNTCLFNSRVCHTGSMWYRGVTTAVLDPPDA